MAAQAGEVSGLVSEWKSCLVFVAEGSWGRFHFLIALVSRHCYMERALQIALGSLPV